NARLATAQRFNSAIYRRERCARRSAAKPRYPRQIHRSFHIGLRRPPPLLCSPPSTLYRPSQGRKQLLGVHRLREIVGRTGLEALDRKSTRLNSSHRTISYAVFCTKQKKPTTRPIELFA